MARTASVIRPLPQKSGCISYPIWPHFHFISKLLKRIEPANAFDLRSSMIQAQPLPEADIFDIQRKARSTCALAGASGQLLKRVTAGIENIACSAATSFGVGARNVS